MIVRFFLGAVLLLPATFCLNFGIPASAASTTPPQLQSGDFSAPETPPPADDGFLKTVRFFQGFIKQGAELEAVLQRVRVATATDDQGSRGANFLRKLSDLYPGATFNGREGTIPLRKDLVGHFTEAMKVDRITETGGITVAYILSQGLVHLTDGTNAATILIDQTTPGKSSFIDVNIAAIKGEAEKIVTDPERKRIAAEPAESAVLTDAYQLMSMLDKTRMDLFAGTMMRDPRFQAKAMGIAAQGYKERHPQDYQAADPTRKAREKIDMKPDKPADQRFYQGFLRLFAFLLSAVAVLWGIFTGIRSMKTQAMDNSRQMRKGRSQALSPMVMRSLKKAGNSLWGRNLPWAKNYYCYERNGRWLLCDGKEEKANKISQARTRIEVYLRSSYFKLKITRLNNAKAAICLVSHDLSKRELDLGLQELILEMTNPTKRENGADDESAVSALSPVDPLPLQTEPIAAISAPIPEPVAPETRQPGGNDPPRPFTSPVHLAHGETAAVIRPAAKRQPRKKAQPTAELITAPPLNDPSEPANAPAKPTPRRGRQPGGNPPEPRSDLPETMVSPVRQPATKQVAAPDGDDLGAAAADRPKRARAPKKKV